MTSTPIQDTRLNALETHEDDYDPYTRRSLNRPLRRALAVLAAAALALWMWASNRAHAEALDQSPAAEPPTFEVASIRACEGRPDPGTRVRSPSSSPGTLSLNCQTVVGLIRLAYDRYASGHVDLTRFDMPIEEGPAWVRSDRYTINAKAEGEQGREIMNGPMLRALLEDRLKLKIVRETREAPVYDLTVGKSGAKLERFKEASCVPLDFTTFPPPPPAAGENRCKSGSTRDDSSNTIVDAHGISLDAFSRIFLANLDRPVVNKTGLTGLYNYHLVYADSNAPPGKAGEATDPAGPLLLDALERQLGLKLVPARGSREFLVISHVERPSEN